MRKIIFLDIDGVLNSKETVTRSSRCKSIIGIDPYLVAIFNRIIFATDAEIVLSSTWRKAKSSRAEIRKRVMDFIDVTPVINDEYAVRGDEVEAWLEKNIGKFYHSTREEKNLKYAILDDDSDFYHWQPLFKSTWEKGLTEEIAEKVIKHLNTK